MAIKLGKVYTFCQMEENMKEIFLILKLIVKFGKDPVKYHPTIIENKISMQDRLTVESENYSD